MFSMEDRRRAVDLYFTQGMTIRKVVAKLGYPSEGAPAERIREDPRYMGACRRSYTVVPGFLRTLVFARPCGDDQFASRTLSPSLDMSR